MITIVKVAFKYCIGTPTQTHTVAPRVKGKRVKETVENDPNDNSVVENLENEYTVRKFLHQKKGVRRKESMKS